MPQVIAFIYEYANMHKVLANLIGTQNRGKRKNGKKDLKEEKKTDVGLGLETDINYRGKCWEKNKRECHRSNKF